MAIPMPAVAFAAVPGRRKQTLELAKECERRGFAGLYCASFGDGMALVGGTLFAIGSIMTRFVLQDLKVATLLFARNLIGAMVFFGIAMYFYGPHHFVDAFAAELWCGLSS